MFAVAFVLAELDVTDAARVAVDFVATVTLVSLLRKTPLRRTL